MLRRGGLPARSECYSPCSGLLLTGDLEEQDEEMGSYFLSFLMIQQRTMNTTDQTKPAPMLHLNTKFKLNKIIFSIKALFIDICYSQDCL